MNEGLRLVFVVDDDIRCFLSLSPVHLLSHFVLLGKLGKGSLCSLPLTGSFGNLFLVWKEFELMTGKKKAGKLGRSSWQIWTITVFCQQSSIICASTLFHSFACSESNDKAFWKGFLLWNRRKGELRQGRKGRSGSGSECSAHPIRRYPTEYNTVNFICFNIQFPYMVHQASKL